MQLISVSNHSAERFAGIIPFHLYAPQGSPAERATAVVPYVSGGRHVNVLLGQQVQAMRQAWAIVDLEHLEGHEFDIEPLFTSETSTEQALQLAGYNNPPNVSAMPRHLRVAVNGLTIDAVWCMQMGPEIVAFSSGIVADGIVAEAIVRWDWKRGIGTIEFGLCFGAIGPNATSQVKQLPMRGFEVTLGTPGDESEGVIYWLGRKIGSIVTSSTAPTTVVVGQELWFTGSIGWAHMIEGQPDPMLDVHSAAALSDDGPQAIDLSWRDVIGGMGSAPLLPGFDNNAAVTWISSTLPRALRSPYNWAALTIGPAPRSGDTGAQEDQRFGGSLSELLQPATMAPYMRGMMLSARKLSAFVTPSRRPSNWRERTGARLMMGEPTEARAPHPQLLMWDGRPDARFSHDMLGLVGSIPDSVSRHGYEGPDREHYFLTTLLSTIQAIGSPGLVSLARSQMAILTYSQTWQRGLATSTNGAARSVGWEMQLYTQFAHAGFLDRAAALYAGRSGMLVQSLPNPVWDPKRDDRPSSELLTFWRLADGTLALGPDGLPTPTRPANVVTTPVYQWPRTLIAYQQAHGAAQWFIAALSFASVVPAALTEQVLRRVYDAAARVMESYVLDPATGHWKEFEILGLRDDGRMLEPGQLVEGQGAHSSGDFDLAWLPGAVWVLLQPEFADQDQGIRTKAQLVWAQIERGLASAHAHGTQITRAWCPPLDRRPCDVLTGRPVAVPSNPIAPFYAVAQQ